jgi:hypothetical protein
VRLDQRMSSGRILAHIFNDGRVTGILRGTPFTPKQEDVSWIMTDRVHGIDSLLRYKESGATVKFVGNESQKGLDLWVLELTDKAGNATRYYISSKSGRILWLEYERDERARPRQVQAHLPRLPSRAGHARPIPHGALRGRPQGRRVAGLDRHLRRQDRRLSLRHRVRVCPALQSSAKSL